MSGYVVRFDRLGRTHNPPDLTVPTGEYENELVDAIEAHARRFCMSRDIEAVCMRRNTEDGRPMEGVVYAGVRLAGQFTIEVTA